MENCFHHLLASGDNARCTDLPEIRIQIGVKILWRGTESGLMEHWLTISKVIDHCCKVQPLSLVADKPAERCPAESEGLTPLQDAGPLVVSSDSGQSFGSMCFRGGDEHVYVTTGQS